MSVDVARVRRPVRDFGSDLVAALTFPFETAPRVFAVLMIAAITIIGLIVAVAPRFVINTSLAGYPVHAFDSTFTVMLQTQGKLSVALLLPYGILTGVGIVNMVGQIQMAGVRSLTNLGGLIPVLAVSGCASCGVGVLALIGLGGALATLPFHGFLVRLGGIGLFFIFLGLAGDPRDCRIPQS